jgi:cytochrome c553
MLETLVRNLHMVRLSALALALVTVGCTGLIDGGSSGGLTPEQAAARKAFVDKAMPALVNCISCHNGSQDTETQKIGFVAGGPDALAIRETLMAYTPAVVNTDAPPSSRVLTKSLHAGPALIGSDLSAILEWIQAEKDALPKPGDGDVVLETTPFVPLLCTMGLPGEPNCPINEVSLEAIGATGSKITFVAQSLGSGLYLNNLKLIPGPTGASIEHPLFVAYPPDGGKSKPDLIDRFFSVKMNIQTGAPIDQQQIAGGTAAFVGFVGSPDPTVADKITIHFKSVGVYQPDNMPPVTAGCKVPAQFETSARAALQASCGNCHRGQNGGATSAVNMTGIDQPNGATPNVACNQIKLRTDTVNLNQSAIYLATTPGNGNHPFNFGTVAALDAFKNAVNVWINAEKVAP